MKIAIRSDEANRHREAQTQQAVHIQQHKEIETAIEEWRQLPPLSFDRTQILEELLESINNQKWMLQDYMVAAESEGFDTVESSMEAIEISRVLDDIAEAQRDAILNRTRDQLTAYQSWILLNHHLKDLRALEVNEQHLWSDLTFEWQHIDLVIANHMASVKTKTKDINTWLKWTRSSIFDYSMVSMALVSNNLNSSMGFICTMVQITRNSTVNSRHYRRAILRTL